MSASDGKTGRSGVPLFPLPNVVLFPRAILPLHIFEERYKAMTADALRGGRQIAMALLCPGWEKQYQDRPRIEPIVCVGDILTHQKLSDGTYNLLLQGHTRARVCREIGEQAYRLGVLEPLVEIPASEAQLRADREKLVELFQSSDLVSSGIGAQFGEMLASGLPTSDVADLIAFNFVEDVHEQQELLAQTNVQERVKMTLRALKRAVAARSSEDRSNVGRPSLN